MRRRANGIREKRTIHADRPMPSGFVVHYCRKDVAPIEPTPDGRTWPPCPMLAGCARTEVA